MKSAPVARPSVLTEPGSSRKVFSGTPSVTVLSTHMAHPSVYVLGNPIYRNALTAFLRSPWQLSVNTCRQQNRHEEIKKVESGRRCHRGSGRWRCLGPVHPERRLLDD